MRTISDISWGRTGIGLLWGPDVLKVLAMPEEAYSIREFFALSHNWPEALPSNSGRSLVVAGLEGCLDVLSFEDAQTWLERDFRPAVLGFQDEYEGQAGLVFWLPSGKQRITMNRASEAYSWRCGGQQGGQELALGRILWSGAECDVVRILDPGEKNSDLDGPAWVGLYHPRIS